MLTNVVVHQCSPRSIQAQRMINALWLEIQQRYQFAGENDIRPEDFEGKRQAFWLATRGDSVLGSIGLKVHDQITAELDAMYVIPDYRGKGIAQKLYQQLEKYARQKRFAKIRLKSGTSQPESLRFYEKLGFKKVACVDTDKPDIQTRCYEFELSQSALINI